MAYAALASLRQTIDQIKNYRQDSITTELYHQITSLQSHVIFLQESLEGFPDRASIIEARIKDPTHLAEDVIESLLSDALLKPTAGSSRSKFKRQLRGRWEKIQSRYQSFVGSSKSRQQEDGLISHDFLELKKVTKKIESVAEQMKAIKHSITVEDDQVRGRYTRTGVASSSTVAPISKEAMVGFSGELMEIKSKLCGELSSKLEVIPIVGMGGIGKTTLAINGYDDPLIVEHFMVRAWVTVSQDYSVQEIASGLLASMEVPDSQSDSMKPHHVYQNLKKRRYLIVLDDIWSTNAWDELKMMFPDDNNGSRIMLTTRLMDLANYVDSSNHILQMQLMDESQSWDLLQQKVFRQDSCPNKLACLGQMIARSCRGLPLAIVVISGILTVDQTKNSWNNIARNVNSVISENDEQYEKILSLSYAHLPHHLKPCFLYMAGFPELYEMRASKLIKLWVAEGFLKPEEPRKSLEEMAEEYLEDLVKRSLVLVTQRKSNGRIKTLSVHDLLREMCVRKAREENFLLQLRGLVHGGVMPPRRVSIIHSNLGFLERCNGIAIRTIICLEDRRRGTKWSVGLFRLLRILDLINAYEYFYRSGNSSSSLPEELFELFHLRYLAFDYSYSIPAAISNLRNLQSLIIGPRKYRGCLGVEIWRMPQHLPPEIWTMPQLRHLVFCSGLRLFQKGATFALESLQTLSLATNFNCSPEILRLIPNLKKLGLYYTRPEYLHAHVINEKVSRIYSLMYLEPLKNIICLKFLENLKLKIHHSLPYPGKKALRALPRSLKKVSLSGLKLPWKHMKIFGSLPNLEVLKLRDFACNGTEWETTEGEFCELRFLVISQSNLRHWITESSHFPRLKCVVLLRCPNLREMPESIGEIPTLEVIEMDNLSRHLVESAKQIQEEQQSCGNDGLQLRFV